MKDSELKVGDKVVCILDQRFKGVVKSIHEKTGFAYQYEVDFEIEVPYDSSGAVFFYWQLKKIEEEEKECWTDITKKIQWQASYFGHNKGNLLWGYYNQVLICTLRLDNVWIHSTETERFKIEYGKDRNYFTIYKKDC